jgi:hypothetical protein
MKGISRMKNVLIQYQGGGYSGCIWEWNLAYIDCEGKYNSLYHSGINGCPDRETFLEKFSRIYHRKYNKCYFYRLDNDAEVKDFVNNSHIKVVILAQRELRELTRNNLLFGTCEICGNDVNNFDTIQTAERIICEYCYNEHTCPNCGAWHDDPNNIGDLDGDTACIDCGWSPLLGYAIVSANFISEDIAIRENGISDYSIDTNGALKLFPQKEDAEYFLIYNQLPIHDFKIIEERE